MRCKVCHYSLQELTEPRCPECGRAFDPNDPGTFERSWRRSSYDHRVVVYLYLGNFVLSWLTAYFILSGSSGNGKDQFVASVWSASLWTVVVAPILMNVYFLLGKKCERAAARDQF